MDRCGCLACELEAQALLVAQQAETITRVTAERDELKRHIEMELLPDDPSSTKANWIDRCYGAENRLEDTRIERDMLLKQVARLTAVIEGHQAWLRGDGE